MKRSDAIKLLASKLHHNWAGMNDEDYHNATGNKRRKFEELEGWELDEMIWTAQAALDQVEALGMLPPFSPKVHYTEWSKTRDPFTSGCKWEPEDNE